MTFDPDNFRRLVMSAFSGKITFLDASNQFTADEIIESFHRVRRATVRALDHLSDDQVKTAPADGSWSISQMVSHLVYTQENYDTALMNFASVSFAPTLIVAREFGAGAQIDLGVEQLRRLLEEATERIDNTFERTRFFYDPFKIIPHPAYGDAGYTTWLVFLLMHEIDHGTQVVRLQEQLADADFSI